VAYNPHSPERGAQYERRGNELVLLHGDYAPPGGGRLQFHFAIGQAF
jgi:hypothetical protein